MGMTDKVQPGVLEQIRKQSAFTVLARVFEALKHYRRQAGLVMLEFIQRYIPMKRILAILPEDYRPYAAKIEELDLRQTDVIVSESPRSENNKTLVWTFFSQLLPMFIKVGIPIPPEVLDYSPLPSSLVERWKAMLRNHPIMMGIPPQGMDGEAREILHNQPKMKAPSGGQVPPV